MVAMDLLIQTFGCHTVNPGNIFINHDFVTAYEKDTVGDFRQRNFSHKTLLTVLERLVEEIFVFPRPSRRIPRAPPFHRSFRPPFLAVRRIPLSTESWYPLRTRA